MNATAPQPFMGKFGVLFSRLPFGWHNWPKAARRVATVLAEKARHCRLTPAGLYERFALSDPGIIKILEKLEEELDESGFKVGRRCIQKGLNQLEKLGVIRRFREGGTRFIGFLVSFSKPKPGPQSGRKSDGTRKPATEPTPSHQDRPAEEKPVDPPLDSAPEGPPVDWRNWQQHLPPVAGTDAHAKPAEAAPRHHFGASLGAAVPTLADPERVRRQEENRKRQLDAMAARRQARRVSGQDQPSSAATSDGTARE
jgi:hypothetical protein